MVVGIARFEIHIPASGSLKAKRQVVSGLLQKTVMVSMPDMMMSAGVDEVDRWSGGLTPVQRSTIQQNMDQFKARPAKPRTGGSDELIKIAKTAICGTDMHIFNWDEWAQKTIPVPMHVGHEYVGTVEAMGAEVRGLGIGQRVSGEGHIV